jgi:tetratricopeptide (TPR) repeat protein
MPILNWAGFIKPGVNIREAIAHYEQSRDLYQQLGKETQVANQWYWLASCYRDWGQYEKALNAEQQDLAIRQKLDDQPNIADAYFKLGWIYQAWGKYKRQSLTMSKAVTFINSSAKKLMLLISGTG